MVVAFYFRLHLAYFPRPVVAIFARPEQHDTDICSYELLSSLCELQRIRYKHGEISRKFYRAFVTAAFRIRSYVDTGKVDFSIVKDTKYYKPGKEYQELVDSILKASGLTEGSQYKT